MIQYLNVIYIITNQLGRLSMTRCNMLNTYEYVVWLGGSNRGFEQLMRSADRRPRWVRGKHVFFRIKHELSMQIFPEIQLDKFRAFKHSLVCGDWGG